MPTFSKTIFLKDESATVALATALSPQLKQGGRIYLEGDLGAGKTSFVRALLRTYGITGRIKSPSYALVEPYNISNLCCYHFDFYRFSDPREWIDAGFRDIFNEAGLILVEWPELAGDLLPPPDLRIVFTYLEEGRNVTIEAYSNKGQAWLNALFPT